MEKTVVITGAARGLGYCIARQHLDRGDRVIACIRRPSANFEELQKECRFSAVTMDVGDTASVESGAIDIHKMVDSIDILYNNAAIFWEGEPGGLVNLDVDTIPKMVNINALGALRVTKALYPLLGDGSVILNISSLSGSMSTVQDIGRHAYDISKAGLNMVTKLMYNDLGRRGIRVFAIEPGWMQTDMGGPNAVLDPNYVAGNIIGIALDQTGIPEESVFVNYQRDNMPW